MSTNISQAMSTYAVAWKDGRKKGEERVTAESAQEAATKVKRLVGERNGTPPGGIFITSMSVLS